MADFGTADLAAQEPFLHEMTHVYQFQIGVPLPFAALIDSTYQYTLTPGQSFSSYGIEQQGTIVADHFRLIQGPSGASPEIRNYEKILPF